MVSDFVTLVAYLISLNVFVLGAYGLLCWAGLSAARYVAVRTETPLFLAAFFWLAAFLAYLALAAAMRRPESVTELLVASGALVGMGYECYTRIINSR